MNTIDWQAVCFGIFCGTAISALFFAGLAWTVSTVSRFERPGLVLMLSALSRIFLLLGGAYWVATAGNAAWGIIGYGLAFLLVRLATLHYAWTAHAPLILMRNTH